MPTRSVTALALAVVLLHSSDRPAARLRDEPGRSAGDGVVVSSRPGARAATRSRPALRRLGPLVVGKCRPAGARHLVGALGACLTVGRGR